MGPQLSDVHKRNLLYTELRKSNKLEFKLEKYRDASEQDNTWRLLLDIARQQLNEDRLDNNLNKEEYKTMWLFFDPTEAIRKP